MLDEATSQVSQEMETLLYQTCQHLKISLMSIGHRDSIRQFHQITLNFDGHGGWTINPSPSSNDGGAGDSGTCDGVRIQQGDIQGLRLSDGHVLDSES